MSEFYIGRIEVSDRGDGSGSNKESYTFDVYSETITVQRGVLYGRDFSEPVETLGIPTSLSDQDTSLLKNAFESIKDATNGLAKMADGRIVRAVPPFKKNQEINFGLV